MSLSLAELGSLQAAILNLHAPRDLEQFQAEAPAIVRTALQADYCLWLESLYSGMGEPLHSTVCWDHPVRARTKLIGHILDFVPQHPFTPHARASGNFGPLRLSDFWTDDQIRNSTIWRDAYRELGIGRLLVCATFRGNRIGVIHVCRPLEAQDFSEKDCLVLQLLMPHYDLGLQAAERVTAQRDGAERPLPTLGLTMRELEVASWLARGRTNPEIATILTMQPRTVEKHVEHILIKLGVENRTTAAMMIGGMMAMEPRDTPGPETSGDGDDHLTGPPSIPQTKA